MKRKLLKLLRVQKKIAYILPFQHSQMIYATYITSHSESRVDDYGYDFSSMAKLLFVTLCFRYDIMFL